MSHSVSGVNDNATYVVGTLGVCRVIDSGTGLPTVGWLRTPSDGGGLSFAEATRLAAILNAR